MPTKLEAELTPEEFSEFCARVAHPKGATKLTVIQGIASEFGAAENVRGRQVAFFRRPQCLQPQQPLRHRLVGRTGEPCGNPAFGGLFRHDHLTMSAKSVLQGKCPKRPNCLSRPPARISRFLRHFKTF